jgi:hypothetical protein
VFPGVLHLDQLVGKRGIWISLVLVGLCLDHVSALSEARPAEKL